MRKKLLKGTLLVSSTLAAMHFSNKYIFSKVRQIENSINGEENFYFSQYGKIFYVKKGEGPPLMLLHGVASGVSSFMWRKNFDEFSKHFTVYAIDLPGFGRSEKLPITYKSYMYRDVIKYFIKDVIGEPANVIANIQSAAYVIRLEYDIPGLFKKIIAVCPSGIFEQSLPPSTSGSIITSVFKTPILGTFLYNMLVSRPGIKYFIGNKTYYNKDLASKYVLNHYIDSSRQNGYLSKYAPASFLGGYLNQNIIGPLQELSTPTLIIWGENAKMNTVNNIQSFKDLRPDLEYYIFPNCGYLPQEEYAVEFNKLCIDFLNK
ncbi:hypothetical protein Q428_01145 [Fervidicella metallireducens AeB]|uniref:AB hydrolase-1 domain-containing protein n=1 Tax=Fervidicella metallireducens AeB TaxID=1403537 RepID=A0A017RZ88_9CLOT|nr:alpha/beta fold hydrolase [Fervidicella metallireducens]EYE89719.1 hypothetical protein Q428_01145 [Fervidicella metallireducens AeB]